MKKLIETCIQGWDRSSIHEIGPNTLKVKYQFHKKLISFCSLMNFLHCNLTFIWQMFIDNVSVFNLTIHELRIKFRNWETILLKYGNFMFQLEPSSNIILAINLLEISPHLAIGRRLRTIWGSTEPMIHAMTWASLTSHTVYSFSWFSLLGAELVPSTWPPRFLPLTNIWNWNAQIEWFFPLKANE